jgi:hypothetical protein
MLTTVNNNYQGKKGNSASKSEERITRNMKKKNLEKSSYFIKRKQNENVNISSTRHTHAKF